MYVCMYVWVDGVVLMAVVLVGKKRRWREGFLELAHRIRLYDLTSLTRLGSMSMHDLMNAIVLFFLFFLTKICSVAFFER